MTTIQCSNNVNNKNSNWIELRIEHKTEIKRTEWERNKEKKKKLSIFVELNWTDPHNRFQMQLNN